MYIKDVRIKNFRNFKELTIPLNRFTGNNLMMLKAIYL